MPVISFVPFMGGGDRSLLDHMAVSKFVQANDSAARYFEIRRGVLIVCVSHASETKAEKACIQVVSSGPLDRQSSTTVIIAGSRNDNHVH